MNFRRRRDEPLIPMLELDGFYQHPTPEPLDFYFTQNFPTSFFRCLNRTEQFIFTEKFTIDGANWGTDGFSTTRVLDYFKYPMT